jgi:aminoglycoside phosphotransferase (APT) family kinase protein
MEKFTGTMPVADRHRFDPVALARWMADHVADFSGPVVAEQFKGGQSNPSICLTARNGRCYVLRMKPAPKPQLLPSAHAIEREYRVQDALYRQGFPVPRMHALCEDESVIGRAFYIMDYVEGRILWDPALPGMSRSERAFLFDEMNRVIALLHSLDYKKIGLQDFGKPSSYFARQIDRWTKQYRASETERIESMERLIEWLPANIPKGEEAAVVHGDFKIDNLILHPSEPRILAVLDWELSTVGHPLGDFAYHCMIWHMPSASMRGISGLPLDQLGIPDEAAYRAAYCRRSGREEVREWSFYLAYNLFRSAGIVQGIMKRALDGIAANPHAIAEGKLARPYAELGWSIAERSIKGRSISA